MIDNAYNFQSSPIILATPIYYGDMAFLCGAFLDWSTVFHQGKLLADKVGGVLTMGGAKNGEVELTLRWVQSVLISQQMTVVGDAAVSGRRGATVWAGRPPAGTGPAPSIVLDAKGIAAIKNLGRRVAEIALRPDTNSPREVLRLR